MNPWRQWPLAGLLTGTLAAYAWLSLSAPGEVRPILVGVLAAAAP